MGANYGRAKSLNNKEALSILNVFHTYYNQVHEVTGVNPARDGSINPNSLIWGKPNDALASNTATKHTLGLHHNV
jgi:hypothetical protein